MKTTKRILAILLTFAMMATVLCLPAFAVENSEPVADQAVEGVEAVADEGTDVIEIATAEQFLAIDDNLEGNYKLTADIEFEEIVHLGSFKGTLDGDGHTLTILGEYSAAKSYGMIFNALVGATIKNIQIGTEEEPVRFAVGELSKGTNIGLLGNNVSGGTVISNVDVYIDADLSGATTSTLNFGAFFPRSTADTTTITNCTANGKINVGTGGGTKNVAGFFGSYAATGIFENCVSNIDFEGTAGTLRVAGIVGNVTGTVTVTNCVNTGTVQNEGTVNGIVYGSSGTLTAEGCVNLGTVNGESGLASAVTQTNVGAGVRIHNTADESGLRFKFTMDEASLDALEALTAVYGAANVQVGAIFLPTELVGEKALTAENYANALTMAGSASEITDGYYHASLVKLYDTHYNTEYSCQSFWRFKTSADGEWITVYANNTLSRTVAGVAAEALANGTYNAEQTAILTAYANAQNG